MLDWADTDQSPDLARGTLQDLVRRPRRVWKWLDADAGFPEVPGLNRVTWLEAAGPSASGPAGLTSRT